MEKINYKTRLMTLVIVFIVIFIVIIYNLLETYSHSNVGDVSTKHLKNKTLEREEFIHSFFNPYFSTIKSINTDINFKNFIEDDLEIEVIQNYFLSIKKALPCLTQVRFLDINGNEVIRADGTPLNLFNEKTISRIVNASELQNKSNRSYFKKFIKLDKDEIGLSFINLNKENGVITLPKQPTLRLGMTVFNRDNEKRGILVINICLRTFFKLLQKATLYQIYLIDGEGKFLNHHEPEYGLLGLNSDYSIKSEFPNSWKAILSHDEYYGSNFFSYKLNSFNNGQDIRMILSLKFNDKLQEREKEEKNFILYLVVFIILALLFVYYLAHLPDLLQDKMKKNNLKNKLTGLPNKLALMEDLSNENFNNSIIILVSINNLMKIQNSYGHKISDLLVKRVIRFLSKYEKKLVKKVYINRYDIYTIRYEYNGDEELNSFLNKLILDLESKTFKLLKKDFEFNFNITLGVSNPYKMNNNLEKLTEAENALEYAITTKKHFEIFNVNHEDNIVLNKEKLNLSKQIRTAIEKDNVILHYQPIFNNYKKRIEKYETLIRLQIEDELIYPDKFLPLAKDINKYSDLSMIVIEKAIEFFKDKEYEFSINLSIQDASNKRLRGFLFNKIKEFDVGDRIVLEIVEQEGIDNYDDFLDFIKEAKSLNCKIAIDDFGSGYSNFEYIIMISEYIDYLKIDGSLIKNIHDDKKSQLLIGTLKFLCDSLQIKTIAEYVEDKEIYDLIVSMDIDYSQGYYIGKAQSTLKKDKSEEL